MFTTQLCIRTSECCRLNESVKVTTYYMKMTTWHRGQFGTGQFGTTDDLALYNLALRTIWHSDVKWTIWYSGQFGTATNLALGTV